MDRTCYLTSSSPDKTIESTQIRWDTYATAAGTTAAPPWLFNRRPVIISEVFSTHQSFNG
jgi:hypothetical protein